MWFFQIQILNGWLVCDTTSINIAKYCQNPHFAHQTISATQVTLHEVVMARDNHLLAMLLGNQLQLIIGETNTFVMGTRGAILWWVE